MQYGLNNNLGNAAKTNNIQNSAKVNKGIKAMKQAGDIMGIAQDMEGLKSTSSTDRIQSIGKIIARFMTGGK